MSAVREMPPQLHQTVLHRLKEQYNLVPAGNTGWLRKGVCPECHGGKSKEPSLYAHHKAPWVLMCGRGSCRHQTHIKDIYSDLFEDVSRNHPATPENPAASADALPRLERIRSSVS